MKNDQYRKSPSQTLAKGISILELFSSRITEIGIREIGRKLEINPTTVYRLVTTLENSGYLDQNPITKRYSLGPNLVPLGSLYLKHNPLPQMATQVFESYAEKFEYNFYLGTLRETKVVYLAALDGRGPIKIVVELGGTTTLHTTALGKVLFAFQDDDFIQSYLETTNLDKFTSRSLTTPEDIWNEINDIRKQNYAKNDGEHYEEVGALGIPIFNQTGEVKFGISIAYPRQFILEKRFHVDKLINLLQEIADEIAWRSGLKSTAKSSAKYPPIPAHGIH
jgi:DNA-binding IclR family transcriptional regulator